MKRGTPKHPKVSELCEILRIRRPCAVGYLELLWHFTAEFTPQGNIGRYSDSRIEAALDWSGTPGRMIQALTKAGWTDQDATHRLLIHDWCDHADEAVRKRLARKGLQILRATEKLTGQDSVTDGVTSASSADDGSLARARSPEPRPEPEPPAAARAGAASQADDSPPPTVAEIQRAVQSVAGTKPDAPRADMEKRLQEHEWMRDVLMSFPGANALHGKPDDVIVNRCLELGRNDIPAIRLALEAMGKAGKRPASSWAWFPTVLAHYLKRADL
jgi:hypothetical protein